MAQLQNVQYFPYYLPPPPHFNPYSPPSPPKVAPIPPPPPRNIPVQPPPSHLISPPPPHPISPPHPNPPPQYPISPPPPHHSTLIIFVFVSLGGIFFLAFLAAALFCFVEKKKKTTIVQETDKIRSDKHVQVHEDIVPGPHGTQTLVLTIDEDVHVEEEINKTELGSIKNFTSQIK